MANRVIVLGFALLAVAGGLYAFHVLDILAYPDPSPPIVEVITQNRALSAEEIERQITLPIEYALAAMPGLTHTRSLSLFGLSDIKFYFDYDTDYQTDRHEVLTRLAFLSLPAGVEPSISPWWSLGEVYRYQLTGASQTLTDLKTIQDWQLNREFKRVHGVIDVTAFGGTTKQYHVDLDPGLLFAYGVGVPDVMDAIRSSNANAGGNYLTVGSQSLDVRGVGLIRDLQDIANVLVREQNGTPIFVRQLGSITTGYRIRLGKVGINDQDDALEGIVLLMRGSQALPVVQAVKQKIAELNGRGLPEGVKIETVYDRSALMYTTVETVLHNLIAGVLLVFAILYLFLGHFRTAVIVALVIPTALLMTFICMVTTGQSANLISLGAVDFGIVIDSTLLMIENVFYRLARRRDRREPTHPHIVQAAHDVGRPIFFATLIIVIAFLPLFTMTGVPGRIFSPMSVTYAFALSGALLMAFTIAPVLSTFWLRGVSEADEDTRLVRAVRRRYLAILSWALDHETWVVIGAATLLLLAFATWPLLGGEFMPALEEGNIWLRATLPIGVSFEEGSRLAGDMRTIFRRFPEAKTVISQLGRPDDGTDPTGFFNVEFLVDLKPRKEWRREIDGKGALVGAIERELTGRFPGVIFNFSQMIQDNVEEAMTGVKGENSIKVFGRDLAVLEETASKIKRILEGVRGIKDLGVLHSLGQPNLLIEADRAGSARYGLEVDDVNDLVQAAIGGQAVTQVYESDRWFDLVVRFLAPYRQDPRSIGEIQVTTRDGSRIPLKQLATIKQSVGPFMVYREDNHRYLPIKFSVRGRDLEGAVEEAQRHIEAQIHLPEGYRLGWYGEYSQLVSEKRRLAMIVPVSLLVIFMLLAYVLHSVKDALLVLSAVPFAVVGGLLMLFATGTHFSISAAVGFLSVFGVSIQGALVDLSRIPEYRQQGLDLRTAILKNAGVRMRPVMMTALAAAIGLIPASISTAIGAQAQQPLARVVVGSMLSAVVLILIVLPVLYQMVHRRDEAGRAAAAPPSAGRSATAVLVLLVSVPLLMVGCGRAAEESQAKPHQPATASERPAAAQQPSAPPPTTVAVDPHVVEELVIEPAEERQVTPQLTVLGRLQYSLDGFVKLSSPLNGRVTEVRVKLGEAVDKDQILAVIRTPDIAGAYADLAKAESDLDLAKRQYELARDLYKAKALPKKEYVSADRFLKQAEAEHRRARDRLLVLKVPADELDKPAMERQITDRFELKAPIAGVAVEKAVSIGEQVDRGEPLYTIANLQVLQAVGEIYEKDLLVVRRGQRAWVATQRATDERFPATVVYVGDVVNPKARTINIRCDVQNLGQQLKADMFVRIGLELGEQTVMALPREAVIRIGEDSYVFVQHDAGSYERRRVSVGEPWNGRVAILEGVQRGERIVAKGGLLLEAALERAPHGPPALDGA